MSHAAPGIIYLGLDVHKDSLTIAVLPSDAKVPTRVDRLPNDLSKLKRLLDRLAREGTVRACYEASGAGYVIQRAMREWGYPGDVIAPSLIPQTARGPAETRQARRRRPGAASIAPGS